MITVGISGIQEAQAANLRILAALRSGSALGRAVLYAASDLHRYAVSVTHVRTGALRASHRISSTGALRAEIYIDPSAVNPFGDRPAEYGLAEHARGGHHAFYERTFQERGPAAALRAMSFLTGYF